MKRRNFFMLSNSHLLFTTVQVGLTIRCSHMQISYGTFTLYLICLVVGIPSQDVHGFSSNEGGIGTRAGTKKVHPTWSQPTVAGPPEPLQSLPKDAKIQAFRTMVNDDHRHTFEIQRLAYNPDIFLLRGVLTVEECDILMESVPETTLAETVTPGDVTSRKHCQVAWLHNTWTQALARSMANLFLSTTVKTHPESGVEDLQILDYQPGGEFVLHHDGQGRLLTILYYLNGVGETWFPLAGEHVPRPQTKIEAMRMVQVDQGLMVGGEHVSINRGDAVAFYNYLDNGDFHWNSLHAGLPVKGESHKWVANHWFRHGGFS